MRIDRVGGHTYIVAEDATQALTKVVYEHAVGFATYEKARDYNAEEFPAGERKVYRILIGVTEVAE